MKKISSTRPLTRDLRILGDMEEDMNAGRGEDTFRCKCIQAV